MPRKKITPPPKKLGKRQVTPRVSASKSPKRKSKPEETVDNPLERKTPGESRQRKIDREKRRYLEIEAAKELRPEVHIGARALTNIGALIPLKPVSTNRLYGGKQYKTKEARMFESAFKNYLILRLPPSRIELPKGPLTIHWRFGVSNKMDVTNCLKLAEDVLASHCGFDDRIVSGTSAVRVPVARGAEFIAFQIVSFNNKDFRKLMIREEPPMVHGKKTQLKGLADATSIKLAR